MHDEHSASAARFSAHGLGRTLAETKAARKTTKGTRVQGSHDLTGIRLLLVGEEGEQELIATTMGEPVQAASSHGLTHHQAAREEVRYEEIGHGDFIVGVPRPHTGQLAKDGRR